jgi:dihydropteroate synthase
MMERASRSLEIKGRRFPMGRRTWLMGIVNVTPDSFSDGGAFFDPERAVDHGLKLACEGADILDIGGESTRPGSRPVPEEEELGRVLPVVRALRRRTGVLLSVDTTKASVARAVLDEGADIINDVSALRSDRKMASVVAGSGAAVVLMHMLGTPATMQVSPHYDDLLGEVSAFLRERIASAAAAGIPEERVVVDPGVGFGKTLTHNLTLLDRLDVFGDLGRPVCVGFSRKAFIGAVLGLPAEERLEGTLAVAAICISRGADILRVHDVGAVAKAARVAEAVLQGGRGVAGPESRPGKEGEGDVR